MYLIGLTGGIASGKSLVAERLAAHGAVHIDADQLARRVVEPGTPALARIAEEFGEAVIRPDGTLDRTAVGALIFRDAERREVLNSITHPAVKALARELIAEAAAHNPHAVVVYDVPLLVEAGVNGDNAFDLIVVVHASLETRIQRLIELRGLTRQEAMHRLNSQATDTERLAVADLVIDNDGDLADTLAQVDRLWERVSDPAA
ncbi:MAG TPA: dephospho-CoA kinase [Terrimesophilobacter sp.]|nr:dephospho-CoA kinase [Terrimesophilobacter sp.]